MKVVVFRLGNEEYGVSMDYVLSIERMNHITHVARTAPYILGVLELRGNVIPIVDVRRYLLDSHSYRDSQSNRIIVVNFQGSQIGIVVDEARDIVNIEDNELEYVPITGMKVKKPMEVAKVNERLIIIMDIYSILMNSDVADALKQLQDQINQ